MNSLATHMRITGLQVTNEDVESRSAAVKGLCAAWKKLTRTDAIIGKAAEVAVALGADGTTTSELGDEVQAAIQKRAAAFLRSERPMDIGIVAGMAAIELMAIPPDASGWLVADIWSAALWSALAFQPALGDAKREALRVSVLEAARKRSLSGAEKARQRSVVADFGEIAIVAGEEAKVAEKFKGATLTTIDALRRNAALDREELDFLWWSLLGRSRLLNRPLSSINEPTRLVAAGIEAAAFLRRFPCEVHRDVVLRTLDSNPEFDLENLILAIGDDHLLLGAQYTNGIVLGNPSVFPLLNGLAVGSSTLDGVKEKRMVEEWAARALLEAGLVKIHGTGPTKL
jgi:hypothetical protein